MQIENVGTIVQISLRTTRYQQQSFKPSTGALLSARPWEAGPSHSLYPVIGPRLLSAVLAKVTHTNEINSSSFNLIKADQTKS